MSRLLLIEDEAIILKALKRLLERNHYEVTIATTVEEGIAAEPHRFDLILADLRLPGAEGTEIIPAASHVPVIIMTSHASVRSAVTAMQSGATDYIAKPFDHDELLMVLERSLIQDRLRVQNLVLQRDLDAQLTLDDPWLQFELNRLAARRTEIDTASRHTRCLALSGESGSGAMRLARALHRSLCGADAPFVVADLPQLQASGQLDSLFTGDEHSLPRGLIHAAQTGSLLVRFAECLDGLWQQRLVDVIDGAVDDTALSGLQRLLQFCCFELSAPPSELAGDKRLLPSLAERLDANHHAIEPIRHHQSLLESQCRYVVDRYRLACNRAPMPIDDDALAALLAYDWPGNIDELDLVLKRGVLLGHGNTLSVDDLGIGVPGGHEDLQRDLSLDAYFRYFVLRNQSHLSETELAGRLGISRKALWERRQKMGLPRP